MIRYREMSGGKKLGPPLRETTSVGGPGPTYRIKATRRPDDDEVDGSGPLQSQVMAKGLACAPVLLLAILLSSSALSGFTHEMGMAGGTTTDVYANSSTAVAEKTVDKAAVCELPRPRSALMHGLPLLAGDRTQLLRSDGTRNIPDKGYETA